MIKPDNNSPYIEAGARAYLRWVQMLWTQYSKRQLKTAYVGNVDDMRKFKDVVKDVIPPLLSIAFVRLELDQTRGAGARKFNRVLTGIDRNRGKSVIRRLTPVRLGFTVRFKTDDGREAVSFAQMMLNAYPGMTFYFEDNLNFRVACRLHLDEGYDLPPADISNAGDLYTMESVFSMDTYIGTVEEQGLIRSIQVRYSAGTGGVATTIFVDEATGKITELEESDLEYTGPFDKTSSQWKGV